MKSLDDFDLEILRQLQQDPSIRMADLAEKVGLSQTPCWRRVKAMEESGVIAGRAVLIDGARLGLRMNVFAHIRLSRHDEETLETLERELRAHPEIVECFLMGGEYDYLLRIVVPDIEEYERYLKKILVHLPGVASVNSTFALKAIKVTTALPI
ncbi:MAG: Lrp/AsnC family transcriptional regulator [Novosphingobium sp.]|nr:Lrp/AsnC family transcriptional regulator [Novosphingobium sp.]